MDVWTTLHAARGEVYDQRSGPVAPAGAEWWVIQLGRTWGSGLPCVRSPTHSLSQQGPTHGYTSHMPHLKPPRMPECA